MKHYKIYSFPFHTKRLAASVINLKKHADRFGLYLQKENDGWYIYSLTPRQKYIELVGTTR